MGSDRKFLLTSPPFKKKKVKKILNSTQGRCFDVCMKVRVLIADGAAALLGARRGLFDVYVCSTERERERLYKRNSVTTAIPGCYRVLAAMLHLQRLGLSGSCK